MKRLSQNNWTHYLYIINFEDGCFYTGVSKRKGDDPLTDGYFGSSSAKKHSERWKYMKFEKQVVALLWCEGHSEAYSIETNWQKSTYHVNDPNCINEHFGSTNFSDDTSRQGGKTQGRDNVESGKGFWRPDLLEIRPKTSQKGGLKGGKSAVQTGQLAEARKKAHKATSKPIILTNIETGEETQYPSLHAAARAIDGSAAVLCRILKGIGKSHKGHTACYA